MDLVLRQLRLQTANLLIVNALVIATALFWLQPVMIPFVLAIFFVLVLTPLIDLQIRYLRAPRTLAVLITLVLGIVILILLGGLISISVNQLADNIDAYQVKVKQLLSDAAAVLERVGINPNLVVNSLEQLPLDTVSRIAVGTTNTIVGILSQGLLLLVFLLFLLLGGRAPTQPSDSIWDEVEARIKRYIVTKALVSAATGVIVGTVLTVLGVDLALVFGLFAFLLNFIPTVGSIVATLLPLPVVLVSQDISVTTAVLSIVALGVIQFVIGNVIEPKIMGDSFDLHPVVVLMALILWGMLWGIAGMLLATPLTAIIKILFEKTELTAPIAELMAGRIGALRST